MPPKSFPDPRSERSGPEAGTVTPVFPLILLETMRDMDRPEETLEDEDVTVSMPRRLGLSDVVLAQVQRLQGEVKRRRPQPVAEVEDLVRLVIRRPDADEICSEAGRRVAQHFWAQRSAASRALIRLLPGPLARAAAHRAAKAVFRQLVGSSPSRVQRWPVELRISRALTAHADPGGAACAFYAGALEELLHQYTGRTYRADHSHCTARGNDACEWTVRLKG